MESQLEKSREEGQDLESKQSSTKPSPQQIIQSSTIPGSTTPYEKVAKLEQYQKTHKRAK